MRGTCREPWSFRDELWSRVLAGADQAGQAADGIRVRHQPWELWPASGKRRPTRTLELQSPHNSHLDVFTHMGIIGAALWAFFWIAWFCQPRPLEDAVSAARRADSRGGSSSSVWSPCWAILIACTFDPTLEFCPDGGAPVDPHGGRPAPVQREQVGRGGGPQAWRRLRLVGRIAASSCGLPPVDGTISGDPALGTG